MKGNYNIMVDIKEHTGFLITNAPENVTCEGCDYITQKFLFLRQDFSKNKRSVKVLCKDCLNNPKAREVIGNNTNVHALHIVHSSFITHERIKDLVQFDYGSHPGAKSFKGELTVGEKVYDQWGEEETFNNTLLAGRESFEGAQIGLDPEQVDKLDAPVDDVRAYLLSQKVVEPKKIEQKEDFK